MPNPKRRHSKTRGKRRTHYKASAPTLMACPNCGEMKLSHRVCSSCGFYDGKSIVITKK